MRANRTAVAAGLVSTSVVIGTMSARPAAANHAGPDHWNQNAAARANVYFLDYTGSTWPVGTVITQWNAAHTDESADIYSYYRSSSTGCPTLSSYCVNVREYTDAEPRTAIGCEGDWGCAKFGPLFTDGHIDTVRVYLNNTDSGDTDRHRTTACHEIGHALGMEHRDEGSASCMADPSGAGANKNVIDADKRHIAELYNHIN